MKSPTKTQKTKTNLTIITKILLVSVSSVVPVTIVSNILIVYGAGLPFSHSDFLSGAGPRTGW